MALKLRGFIFTVILISLLGISFAQEFPISTAPPSQLGFYSTTDGTNYIATWVAFNNMNSGSVHAQVISNSGELQGSVLTFGTHPVMSSQVDFDGSNYLLSWVESGKYIGQLISPSGTLVGPAIDIDAALNSYGQTFAGGFSSFGSIILYIGSPLGRSASAVGQLTATTVSSSGQVAPLGGGGQGCTMCEGPLDQLSSTASNQVALLVWLKGKYTFDIDSLLVDLSQINSNGGNGNYIPTSTVLTNDWYDKTDHEFPTSTVAGNGLYLVTWSQYMGASSAILYGEFVNRGGQPNGAPFEIANVSTGTILPQQTLFDENENEFIVTWLDSGGTPNAKIMGREITSTGQMGDPFTVLGSNENGSPSYYHISSNGQNYFIIVTRVSGLGQSVNGFLTPINGSIYGVIRSTLEAPCVPNWNCTANGTCGSDGTQSVTCVDANNCGAAAPTTQNCTPPVQTCTPNWNCTYGQCSSNGTQMQICTDLNDCNTTSGQPVPNTQVCVPASVACFPDWSCTTFSNCAGNGTQTRTCTDINNCNTTSNEPIESQKCNASNNTPIYVIGSLVVFIVAAAVYLVIGKKPVQLKQVPPKVQPPVTKPTVPLATTPKPQLPSVQVVSLPSPAKAPPTIPAPTPKAPHVPPVTPAPKAPPAAPSPAPKAPQAPPTTPAPAPKAPPAPKVPEAPPAAPTPKAPLVTPPPAPKSPKPAPPPPPPAPEAPPKPPAKKPKSEESLSINDIIETDGE